MVDSLRERIAEERAKLDGEFAEQERAYQENKRLIDDFERLVFGAENGRAKPPEPSRKQPEGKAAALDVPRQNAGDQIGISQAVRLVLQDHKARTTGETTKIVDGMKVKRPQSKSLAKAVSLALYSLKRAGQIEFDEGTRKYRMMQKRG